MTMNDVYEYNEYADRFEEEIAKEEMAKVMASLTLKNNKL